MFYQISLSPQLKRSAIISNKHGIYELPNNTALSPLGGLAHTRKKNLKKLGKVRKISKFHRIIA